MKLEIGNEVHKLAKQIVQNYRPNLRHSGLKLHRQPGGPLGSTAESIKLILQQLDEIKSQVCITEQSLLAHMQDNVSSSPILNNPQNPQLAAQEDAATTNER